MSFPDTYDPHEAEPRWQKFWIEQKIFAFDVKSKKPVYSIDTPPPTVSGKMHLGHAFSYTQQDFIARYKRMRGYNVFYPFGTDDNGVATERLIEKMKGVQAKEMDREQFRQLCLKTLDNELRPGYLADWKRIGMSCDWSIFYDTIDTHSQRISQRSFIELYNLGREYRKEAPTMWCPECQTGISQVECQDKELESTFNDIVFTVNGKPAIIGTTRPELLPACVAVFYHPDDTRYQALKGKRAVVPLFNQSVPILPDERADPEKGTGLVMCCTFGDQTDMEWQKAHNLPIVEAIGKDGRMTEKAGIYHGQPVKGARKNILKELQEKGLLKQQKSITHAVNVHERCGIEIEFVKSKQWFIKYLDLREDMLKWGKKLHWYPDHMRARYDHWVKGLQWDWLISRQRYFGVPFPVWYCKKCDAVILASVKDLPVDPLKDTPPVKKCPQCAGTEFLPEKDILDTWATSSLTPQLASELMPKEVQKKLFPMNLRPQAHDIITFWLFNTAVKSQLHTQMNPWQDVMISGHAQDPHGKKMSKSKGNIIEPQEMIAKYSADALRFWAAGSTLGDDLPFQEKDLVSGKKLTTKLWNAAKLSTTHLQDYQKKPAQLEVIDHWILSKLRQLVGESTRALDRYEYNKPKLELENFFWHTFCDNYLEIVKDRLYNPDRWSHPSARPSAQYGLYTTLLSLLKMLAPFVPHITEEIYQQYFAQKEGSQSIHQSPWPTEKEILFDASAEQVGDVAVDILATVRKMKSDRQLALNTEVETLVLSSTEKEFPTQMRSMEADLKAVTRAKSLTFTGKTELKTARFGIGVGLIFSTRGKESLGF